MILKEEDSDYFFSVWLPLVNYVNKKYKLYPMLDITRENSAPTPVIAKIADRIWKKPGIIDEYIAKNKSLADEDKDVLHKWRNHFVHGEFVVDRHLKNGSILINADTQDVYLVKGMCSTIAEMLGPFTAPQIVKATLLPFKGVIVRQPPMFKSTGL